MPNDSRARREQMRAVVRRARAAESEETRRARLALDRARHRHARDGWRGQQQAVRQARDLRQQKLQQHWRPSAQPFVTDPRQAPGHGHLNQGTKGFMVQTARPVKHNSRSTVFNSVPFCFGCDELFADRVWLEEHLCPAMTYICSCGTEFSDYTDMMKHSTEHEPGQSVLHHATIQRRRAEKQQKARQQLRLFRQPAHMKPGVLPQVHEPAARMPAAPLLIPPSVPTMDLWALYQPVVVIETLRRFDKDNPYQCATCEQGFRSKNYLIKHHSSHVCQRVIGCLRCGLLLPTNKAASDRHVCHSPSTATLMERIATAPKATVTTAPNAAATTAPSVLNNRNLLVLENKMASPRVAQAHALLKHLARENAGDPGSAGYRCRVCQIPFDSVLLLQRHQCALAADYAKRQALIPNNHKKTRRLTTPYNSPQNNVAANCQVSREDEAYQDKAVGTDRALVKTEEDSDNDCYVIEDASSRPSQLFKNPNVSPLPVIKT